MIALPLRSPVDGCDKSAFHPRHAVLRLRPADRAKQMRADEPERRRKRLPPAQCTAEQHLRTAMSAPMGDTLYQPGRKTPASVRRAHLALQDCFVGRRPKGKKYRRRRGAFLRRYIPAIRFYHFFVVRRLAPLASLTLLFKSAIFSSLCFMNEVSFFSKSSSRRTGRDSLI